MKTILIVLKKELKDLFRDRKTLIISLLIPLLLNPVIFGIMGRGMEKEQKSLQEGMKISIQDAGNSSFTEFIKSQDNIDIVNSDNLREDVKKGDLDLALEIPKDFDEKLVSETPSDINIIYDNTSTKSSTAISMFKNLVDTYSKSIVSKRLEAKNMDSSILTPINISAETTTTENDGQGVMMLSLLLPMFLVMFSASSPIAVAVDLGAGEKERGTLEPLLTTQANRTSLLWGKMLATMIIGVMTTLASLLGLIISFKISPSLFGHGSDLMVISPLNLSLICLITILLNMVFSALALTLSVCARSAKEANTYLTPLTLVGFIGFLSYMLDVKTISLAYLNIPIVNIVVVLKELTLNIFNPTHLIIVFAWTLVYISASILLARYMFSKEEVIFRT